MPDITLRQCTDGKVHVPHTWWSRRQRCYFQCFGRREPRRLRRPKAVS